MSQYHIKASSIYVDHLNKQKINLDLWLHKFIVTTIIWSLKIKGINPDLSYLSFKKYELELDLKVIFVHGMIWSGYYFLCFFFFFFLLDSFSDSELPDEDDEEESLSDEDDEDDEEELESSSEESELESLDESLEDEELEEEEELTDLVNVNVM